MKKKGGRQKEVYASKHSARGGGSRLASLFDARLVALMDSILPTVRRVTDTLAKPASTSSSSPLHISAMAMLRVNASRSPIVVPTSRCEPSPSVSAEARNKGVGKALLFACLEDMRAQGFAYAIIGGVGPAEFYAKAVGAVAIFTYRPHTVPETTAQKDEDWINSLH